MLVKIEDLHPVLHHPDLRLLGSMMIGQTISHYRILEKLGEGGMGAVFRAHDTTLDRDVAIKILPPDIAEDPQYLARFEQEAKTVATLSHPNIMAIFEFGCDQGQSFAVMELLKGETLSERLLERPLPLRKAVDLSVQIAEGLAAAHERGVVHRDLKPANIFITTEGHAKILDFGLARLERGLSALTRSATEVLLTEPGTVLGTVTYMSPEQARGESVDARSDIFSLGAVLYEMFTGSCPFARSSAAETIGAILHDEPRSIHEKDHSLPESLNRFVLHCLEKEPGDRFQSARDLAFALASVPSTPLSGDEPSEQADKAGSLGRALRPWSTVLGWLAAAGVLGYLFLHSPAPYSPPRLTTITYSGRDWAPSASPAEDMIAFVSDRDGQCKIWLKHMAGGGEVSITEGPDNLPRFSPDGSQILFVRGIGGNKDLFRVSVVGGQPRRILENGLEGDWSPDGTQVAFLRIRPEGEGNVAVIGVAEVQTGNERILNELENRLCYGIRWSPDGRVIAVSDATQTGQIARDSFIDLIDVATGACERITLSDLSGSYTAVHWTPSGRSFIAGQATETVAAAWGGLGQIVEYEVESGHRRPLFWMQLLIPLGGRYASTIAGLDAGTIIIDEHVFQARLYEVACTGTIRDKPLRSLTSGLARDRQPAYSTRGDRILFSSSRSGNIDVWIVDRLAGELRQLTDHPADDYDPAFTPDGEHLLWSSGRDGPMEIWMAATDGSGARQVTHDGVDAENPTMTADGNWIVYGSSNPEGEGIWKIRPDGSDVTRLVPGAYALPEVSPDGRFAIFTGTRGVNSVILAVEIETGEMVPFEIVLPLMALDQVVVLGRCRWTPDGCAIAYISVDDKGHTGVFVQDFVPGQDTSRSRRPLAGFSPDFTTESLGISPDGKSIVISAMIDQQSLKLAEGVELQGWE
jgi:serine/threonine protein kinase/Tol biopolymer transport system component